MQSIPLFSRSQLAQARGLTPTAAESVVAAATDTPVSQWRQWRKDGTGPDYQTTVSGQTVYRRDVLLAFIMQHMDRNRR
ncbi:hypothetical protein [Bifidobacterium saguinibicoloris]|uniref:hypothetical protein n=1 Tax=Bifidobacterium saguinibicoloris TaxID=2834433 RepID=UPI001C59675C|nr:hypothetical protein [Bifidobacterium saguinibicoloris]MBW3080670.1 hypothetical protein [Bifidobacterium saguinibicoloris]